MIIYLGRINFEFLYYMKKFSVWHTMLYFTKSVVISVMGLLVYSREYAQLYDVACVSPCDSKAKIKYFVIAL